MSTKFGKHAQKPPLSVLDKTLYGSLIALSLIIPFLFLVITYIYDNTFLFADKSIIASTSFFGVTCIPLILFVSITLGILSTYGLKSRQPLFGNPNFIPKAFAPTLKAYPLFSPEFRQTPEQKKYKKTDVILLCLFFVFLFVAMLGFFPRETLDENGVFRTHNMINQVTHITRIENADFVSFEIERSDGGGKMHTTHWYLYINFYFEDKSYEFHLQNFASMSSEEALRYLLTVKEQFQGRYELYGVAGMNNLMANYTEKERELLYELFDRGF